MKKIVVINGHPDHESFNTSIANTYLKSAFDSGAEVRYIALRELTFDPNLKYGYRKRMELEPDLISALQDIHWSEHQVWIHPLWWLGLPALMKGFFDRTFLPGITFKNNKGGISEGLLKDKTGRIIATAGDLTADAYQDSYQSSGLVQLQKGILAYCGLSDIQSSFIGPMHEFNENDRKKWLEKIKILAIEDAMQKRIY